MFIDKGQSHGPRSIGAQYVQMVGILVNHISLLWSYAGGSLRGVGGYKHFVPMGLKQNPQKEIWN